MKTYAYHLVLYFRFLLFLLFHNAHPPRALCNVLSFLFFTNRNSYCMPFFLTRVTSEIRKGGDSRFLFFCEAINLMETYQDSSKFAPNSQSERLPTSKPTTRTGAPPGAVAFEKYVKENAST